MKGGFMIKEMDTTKRKSVIDLLKENGYQIDKDEFRGDQGIIDSILPIIVTTYDKSYRMMGNVTCAAAAARSERYINADELRERLAKEG